MLLEILDAVVLYVHTCAVGYGSPISSNIFLKMLTSVLVTRHPLVSASAAEAGKEL